MPRFSRAVLVVAVAVGVVACSGGSDDDSTQDDRQEKADEQKPVSRAAATRAAYVDGERHVLVAFDKGKPHDVQKIPGDESVRTVDWSAGHGQLVASFADTVISWAGAGSKVVEAPCADCDVAFLDRPGGDDLVAGLTGDNTIATFAVKDLKPAGTAQPDLPGPDQPFVLYGDVGGNLLIAHSTEPESSSPDTLWLVDPVSGKSLGSHGGGPAGVHATAVDATAEKVAYVGHWERGPCGSKDEVHVLDAKDLSVVDDPAMPAAPGGGSLEVEDLFFNGDALYATMVETRQGDGDSCPDVGSAGLWRLGDDARGWTQVDPSPLVTARPVEGLGGDPGTGKLVIDDESRDGTFVRTGKSGSPVDLGLTTEQLWATPTRHEVDLAGNANDDGDDGSDESSGGDASIEAAVARAEEFLHALGDGDIATICEIAGPAAKQAEDQGFGPCESTFATVLEMISPEQAAALRDATIDPTRIEKLPTGAVEVPVEAVVASVTFTESDLGDYTLNYQDGNWFIID